MDTELNPLQQRRAGLLLHPTSLPSGKLDSSVERWIDFMHEAGFSVWQMLPLVIPDHTGSPYQSCSAFAFNPDLLDDYSEQVDDETLVDFMKEQSHWLLDYALFKALKIHFDDAPWSQWPEDFRFHNPEALEQFQHEMQDEIDDIIKQQYLLKKRWDKIHQYARNKGIYLFGDMPIFVAYDSADVWANPRQFLLDEAFEPTYVAGVPPDYFSETGQRWGNPHYDWQAMLDDDFRWWKARVMHKLERFDIVRIDHFRGLLASWMIEASEETAINGFWQENPGDELLHALQQTLPELAIVAEDLGIITDEVRELRQKYRLPGMSVVQFAFDAFDDNPHKPKNITPDTVAYTGTHDNDTTAGWFKQLGDSERRFVYEVLGKDPQSDIVEAMCDSVLESQANLAVFPLQDLLGLGSEARMNTPGQSENNWTWKFEWDDLPDGLAEKFRQKIIQTGRLYED